MKANHYIELEAKYLNCNGIELPILKTPHQYSKIESSNPKFVDEGFLICEVKKIDDREFLVNKVNSRLDLRSSTTVSLPSSNNLAQIAINTTGYWFSNEDVVAATGYAEKLLETEDYGVYRLEIQIQKWR
ncbi:TPA: hypothetical protein NKS14_004570 [Vibrio parahaemolyticus]|uniref:hypothetical protein n=1 Tax=Shewanella algae TaxID=38313 RepID=UPI0031F48FAE|nr:hypothetical protein [Vibrio parahaemolyticus]